MIKVKHAKFEKGFLACLPPLTIDLSLHCTDFFLERRNRSYYLHCLEEVDLQMEVKMRSEVVSLQANHLHITLSRADFYVLYLSWL